MLGDAGRGEADRQKQESPLVVDGPGEGATNPLKAPSMTGP